LTSKLQLVITAETQKQTKRTKLASWLYSDATLYGDTSSDRRNQYCQISNDIS